MSRTTYSRRSLSSKGNPPPTNYIEPKSKIASMRETWENNIFPATCATRTTIAVEDSPTLTQLREHSAHERPTNKVSGYIHAAQQELEKMHHKAKSNVAGISGVGGGVSIWPAMDDMRLSRNDLKWLVVVCVVLVTMTFATFFICHGKTLCHCE